MPAVFRSGCASIADSITRSRLRFMVAGLTIFGSSNWSWQSFNYQEEHNYFTNKTWFFQWFVDQFNRKWNSATEYEAFVPLPPSVPTNQAQSNGGVAGVSAMLKWEGGGWAHKYDVYLGTNPNSLSRVATDLVTGTIGPEGGETRIVSGLQSGITYFWRVVSKTMANQTADGPVWSFTVSSTAPTPTPPNPRQFPVNAYTRTTSTPTQSPTPTPSPTPSNAGAQVAK